MFLPALMTIAAANGSAQATVTADAAAMGQRMIVVYRDNTIPGDAEGRTARIGGRVLRRHERFGATLVMGTAAAETALRQDSTVAYVVEDRPVLASGVTVQAAAPKLDSSTMHTSGPGMVLPTDGEDAYYNATPQGWAVKSVGGSGGEIGGGPATGAWATSTGKGIRIAVLDSGVDRTHADIAPNLVTNLTEVDQTQQPSACDDGSPQDQSGHGTFVASLAAGAAGPSTGMTVGVAPGASILNIKVMQRLPGTGSTTAEQCRNGQASGMLSWVLQGIEDAIAQHADVVVLSMATTLDLYSGDAAGLKASFDRVTHAAADAGVVVVAAAGNDAFDFSDTRYVSLPAQSRDVLAVTASTNPACAENVTTGATCAAGPVTRPYYSNYGAPLNAVAAPGGSYPAGTDFAVSGWVRGACTSGLPGTADGMPTDANHSEGCFNLGHQAYAQAIGTSASAPLVAGVVALVKAAHPDWTAATVVAAVRSSAGATGVVDAGSAIAYLPQP